ncbi:MAG: PIG-L family deacetylase, partial [Pirellulaceae bacterium]
MIQAQFNTLKSILCIGAHADDIEIGCGGTLLKMLSMYDDITVNWVVLSGAGGPRADEARCAADKLLVGAADSNVIIKDFRDRFFPYDGESVKEFFFE